VRILILHASLQNIRYITRKNKFLLCPGLVKNSELLKMAMHTILGPAGKASIIETLYV